MAIRVQAIPFPDLNEMVAYLAWCPQEGSGVLVDPGGWDERVEALVARHQVNVTGLLVTHGHWDHIGGLAQAQQALGAPVYASARALETIGQQQGALRTEPLAQGDVLTIGGHPGQVWEIPGHTEDHIVVYIEGHLLGGDVLFAAAVGGTSTVEAFHTQMTRLRRLLAHLPADTVVHGGHGPVTQVALERVYNPFLKGVEPRWKKALGGW